MGTPLYIAPEVVKGEYYSDKADVYSFALTLLAFGLKNSATLQDYLKKEYVKIYPQRVPNLSRLSHELIVKDWRPNIDELEEVKEVQLPVTVAGLLDLCWQPCPAARPSFDEIAEFLAQEVKNEVMGGGTGTGGSRRTSTSGSLAMKIRAQQISKEQAVAENAVVPDNLEEAEDVIRRLTAEVERLKKMGEERKE